MTFLEKTCLKARQVVQDGMNMGIIVQMETLIIPKEKTKEVTPLDMRS